MYQAFKEDLLQELVIQRDITVIRAQKHRRQGLFGVRSQNDKIYASLVTIFESVTLKKTRELIFDLCKKHNIPALDGREMLHDIIISKDNKRTHYVVLNKIESINSEQFYMLKESMRAMNEPCVLVFLLENTFDNKLEIQKLADRFYMQICKTEAVEENLSCLLFDDFLVEVFGEDEAKEFNKMLGEFMIEFHNLLGYQITEICTPYSLGKLKTDILQELKTFPYESIRQKTFPEIKSKYDINDISFQRIYQNFFKNNKYEVLVKNSDFAISFLTSEWLYKKYVMLESLDNTFIVAGYLKSIEQLLWSIIKITAKGKYICGKKIDEKNNDSISATLGTLEYFIIDEANSSIFADTFKDNKFVIHYLRSQIALWREKKRNGLFHKTQLNDKSKIDSIREETIFLYFLILGALKLDDYQVKQLEN